MSQRRRNLPYELDQDSSQLENIFNAILFDIQHCKKKIREVLEYHAYYYSISAHQRARIFDDLKSSLAKNSSTFGFGGWTRIVSYKYSNQPLSAKGSVLNDPGGRFNIGAIDIIRFPTFPALYIAQDFPTAFREFFGQSTMIGKEGISEEDLALADHFSLTKICIRGQIEQVLDVNQKASLREFVSLIKDFRLPNDLVRKARKLKLHLPRVVKDVETLQRLLLDPDWRNIPQLVDTPATSQILGQIAHAAGLEAILYRSKRSNKNCLAVFVENFRNSPSFLELEGDFPKEVVDYRVDSSTWEKFR